MLELKLGCHLRNQTRQILEMKSVISEIKRVKF